MRARPWLSIAIACALVACHSEDDFTPSNDPARVELMKHLGDGRPLARITAMRGLAPKANRFEVHEIADKARSGNEQVRIEAARALGVARPRDAIDLLGRMLQDPLDSVRAAAVDALATKHDPKADAYVAHVYETGGPLTRAAVARAGATVFAEALAEEAADRQHRVDRALHFDKLAALREGARLHRPLDATHPDIQLESAMLEELGRSGQAGAVKELTAKLADPDAVVAAGAALGLAHAGAKEALPALEKAVFAKDDVLAPAAAEAVIELDPSAGLGALVDALPGAGPALTRRVVEALRSSHLDEKQAAKVCDAARKEADATLAIELFHAAGASCAADPALPDDAGQLAQKLLVLAAVGPKTPELLGRARALLAGDDARVAAAAATYLGVFGAADDATLLATTGSTELAGLDALRAQRDAAERGELEAAHASDVARLQMLSAFAKQTGQKPPSGKVDRLTRLLENAKPVSDTGPVRLRPGSVELVASAFAGAARLGADAGPLVDALVAEDDPRLRAAAVDVADLAGAPGEAAREKLRASKDRTVAVRMALRDAAAKRPGALARLAKVADEASGDDRAAVVAALGAEPAAAADALVRFAEEDDVVALPALRALGKVAGAPVDRLLAERAESSEAGIALAAVDALTGRPGAAADEALARAATHPDAGVREAALVALAKRKACGEAALVAPLSREFERRVRSAADALLAACPPAPGAKR